MIFRRNIKGKMKLIDSGKKMVIRLVSAV